MRITNISPAEAPERSDGWRRGGKDAEGETARARARFSPFDVILDLSPDALKQIGQAHPSAARPARLRLFIYDHAGGFAYDEPARPETMTANKQETPTGEAPSPTVVAFDGMLDTRPGA